MKDIYNDFLGTSSQADVINKFIDTAVTTNRDFRFLVDWKKIEKQIEKYKLELSLFDTLIKSKDFDKELLHLLGKYPKTAEAVPILLALSEKDSNLTLVKDFLNWDFEEFNLNFKKFSLKRDMAKIVMLFEESGLKYFFQNMSAKSILDYATGVKVGMDTNARKNRSGNIMEKLLKDKIKRDSPDYEVYPQKKFKYFKDKFYVPDELLERKADFILSKAGTWINIEVNFYNTPGSKPGEIVGAYISRQRYIKKAGGHFIWITDGVAWKEKNANKQTELKNAFDKMDYVLNLHFVKNGLLKRILNLL